nr:5195_t:CDS:2 [Entrophospora candida]
MEKFFITYINAVTVLYKRVESGDWTNDREMEIHNFQETLGRALKLVPITDERFNILSGLGTGEDLKKRASSASAERKGSFKRARRPDFSVIVKIKNEHVEIGYLETERPDSTAEKQLQDHKKLNRLSKDSIDAFLKRKQVFMCA